MPKTLQELQAELDAAIFVMEELSAMEPDDFASDPENETKYNEAVSNVETLKTEIENTQKRHEAHAQRQAAASAVRAAQASQPTGSGGGTGVRAPVFGNQREGILEDPKGGFRDIKDFLGVCLALGEADKSGKRQQFLANDERAKAFSSSRIAVQSGAAGQFSQRINNLGETDTTMDDLGAALLLPTEFAPQVLKADPALPTFNTSRVRMNMPTLQQKYRVDFDHRDSVTGGFQVGRKMERCVAQSSRAEYRTFNLTAYTLFGAYAASEELLDWSPDTIVDEVEEGFRTEFESNRIMEILNGKEHGEYAGIWQQGTDLVIVVTPSNPAVPTVQDLYAMEDRIYVGSDRSGLVYMAGNNWKSYLKNLQDTTGSKENTHFFYESGGPDWADGTLNGIPIKFSPDYIPGVGYKGQIGLYNMSEYREGFWQPMKAQSSMHARFLSHERVFKFWTYSGGHPLWERSMIPKWVPDGESDSDIEDNWTISPFVVMGGTATSLPAPNRPHNSV